MLVVLVGQGTFDHHQVGVCDGEASLVVQAAVGMSVPFLLVLLFEMAL